MNTVFDENKELKICWGKITKIQPIKNANNSQVITATVYVGDKYYIDINFWNELAFEAKSLRENDLILCFIDSEKRSQYTDKNGNIKMKLYCNCGFFIRGINVPYKNQTNYNTSNFNATNYTASPPTYSVDDDGLPF